jgi:hypothetical protein
MSSISGGSHMIRILYYRMNFSYSDFRLQSMSLALNNEWTKFCAVMLCIRCLTYIQWYEAYNGIHVTCNLYLATVRSSIINIHVVCYCCENDIFDRYDGADGITDDVTGIMFHGLIFENWMHSFEVSLGYESVDRSTFSMKRGSASCWKCSSINAFKPQWNFKRMHSILLIIFKSHQNLI